MVLPIGSWTCWSVTHLGKQKGRGLQGHLEETGCVADTQQGDVPPCQGRESAFQLASVVFLSKLTQISFLSEEEMTGCFVALGDAGEEQKPISRLQRSKRQSLK